MDDKRLLKLVNANPSEGLSIAIDKYGGLVKSAVVRVLGSNHPDVEECIADAFIKLWRNCCKVSAGSLRSYLYTLARNSAIDILRKDGSRQVIELDDDLESPAPSLEDTFIDNVNRHIVSTCVNELPEPDRTIFLRRYYHGERVKEIAENLGIKPKKVENTLFRGKQQLEQKLMDMGVLV